MKLSIALAAGTALACNLAGFAQAEDLEVTHWWTSAGEASAVAEFAKAFDATGNRWVDAAIAGGGGSAILMASFFSSTTGARTVWHGSPSPPTAGFAARDMSEWHLLCIRDWQPAALPLIPPAGPCFSRTDPRT